MTGLFFLAIFGLWLCVSAFIAWKLVRRIRFLALSIPLGLLAFAALFVAPMADEIVGGMEFRAMCAREAVLTIEPEKVRGRSLRRSGTNFDPPNTLLKIERWREGFFDVETGEELIRYVWLRTGGGWLIRAIGIFPGDAPLLIYPATCAPKVGARLDKKNEFTLVND